jgi:hypothetical protein
MNVKKSLLASAILGAAMLASGAASAGVIYPLGVGIPTGYVPGGFYISAETSYENVVTAPGQNFSGIFLVDSIKNSSAQFTYQYGNNNAYLHGVFRNFIADTINLPTSSTAGTITFKGGEILYYVSNTNTFTNNQGQATDFANASAGTLWLAADPAVLDAAGHTLIITIPVGGTLTQFNGASAQTLLNVRAGAAGGAAGVYFDTNTFTNSYDGSMSDILFQGSADTGASGDFPISGTNHIKTNIFFAPEPISIAMFGTGLMGAAAFGARRKKKLA